MILAGARALPALETYCAADLANEWGAAGIAAAAIDHLRRIQHLESGVPPPDANAIQWFAQLIEVAEALRHQS